MENLKKYKIFSSEKNGICEISLTGEFTIGILAKMVKNIYNIIAEMNPEKLLIDFCAIKGHAGYPEIYCHFIDYPSSFHHIKHAIVDIPERSAAGAFHQYLATHVLGISLKCFTNIDDARNWLNR